MPFSFIEIEQQKTRKIVFLFIFLVFFYFLSALFVVISFKLGYYFEASSRARMFFPNFSIWPSAPTIFITLIIALIVAVIHWYYSTRNLIDKMSSYLNTQPLDLEDTYHQRFKNVVEEVSTAIGGKEIEGCVINTNALNAFALADFKGRSIIGATEGLLVKLNRRQLEAVVGHEAGHIASGDCLATTVTSSLFELYTEALKILKQFTRGRNRAGLPVLFLILALTVTKSLTFMINMFISREKEYRADAVSSRLTRDPLSLAEALHLISTNWRGAGTGGDELASIFIISPRWNELEESEGFFANLFSTHPPIHKRISIMLDMGHADVTALKGARGDTLKQEEEIITRQAQIPTQNWFIRNEGTWQGPFNLTQLAGFDWFKPDAWVYTDDNQKPRPAYQENELSKIFKQQLPSESSQYSCPKCQQALIEVLYEGMPIWKCHFCKGHLISQNRFPRIISREVFTLRPEIAKLAKAMRENAKETNYSAPRLTSPSQFSCPACSKKMVRSFYPAIYPIKLELDQCLTCQVIWFDKDELELAQYFSQGDN